MQFNTLHNIGDTIWVVDYQYSYYGWSSLDPWKMFPKPVTVGRVEVRLTRTEDKHEYCETYMCTETGIGSGSLYYMAATHEKQGAWSTKERCQAYINRKQLELL